jgi:hypothetical protein
VSKERGVVRGVWLEDGEWWAAVSVGFYATDERDVPVLELELAPAYAAVDPHAGVTTDGPRATDSSSSEPTK